MKAVVLLLCLFVAYSLANHVVTPGRYRQCSAVGDEIILDIGAAPTYYTTLTSTTGGCLENATSVVPFTTVAHYQWQFADSKRKDNNGTNVEFIFSDAKVTPHTSEAALQVQRYCGYRFVVGQATNVLGCLFCSPQYDIYREVTPGVFVLGDGIACTPEDRPSTFENATFVRIEVSPTPFPVPFPPQGVGAIPPVANMTYLDVDDDDDPNNDGAEDEDDEGFDNDDDEDFTATPSPTLTPSRSFVVDNGAAMMHIALGVIVFVIFVIV